MSRSKRKLYRAVSPVSWPTKGAQKKMARKLYRKAQNRAVDAIVNDENELIPKKQQARGNRDILVSSMQVNYGAGDPVRLLGKEYAEKLKRK